MYCWCSNWHSVYVIFRRRSPISDDILYYHPIDPDLYLASDSPSSRWEERADPTDYKNGFVPAGPGVEMLMLPFRIRQDRRRAGRLAGISAEAGGRYTAPEAGNKF